MSLHVFSGVLVTIIECHNDCESILTIGVSNCKVRVSSFELVFVNQIGLLVFLIALGS